MIQYGSMKPKEASASKNSRINSSNPRQNTIALIYDFDGTLTPASMQEYTLFPALGISKSSKFWLEVDRQSRENGEEWNIAWMRMLKELAEKKNYRIDPKSLTSNARKIRYFPGVQSFFKRINVYVRNHSKHMLNVRHYIVSSGLKEILDGISIRNEFTNIFGSEYHYNKVTGIPDFPKVVISDTMKTQYIFRINKGKEALWENINNYMPEENRPIPFKNIVYIGDGLSDVPAMNVTKKNGGYAVAVYRPNSIKGKENCERLQKAGRVDFIAPADYRLNSKLDKIVKLILDTIIQRYEFDKRI